MRINKTFKNNANNVTEVSKLTAMLMQGCIDFTSKFTREVKNNAEYVMTISFDIRKDRKWNEKWINKLLNFQKGNIMKNTYTTDDLHSAIATAKREVKNPYALAYLNAFSDLGILYGDLGIKTQLLYILNNLSTWRGVTARECKLIFKHFSK